MIFQSYRYIDVYLNIYMMVKHMKIIKTTTKVVITKMKMFKMTVTILMRIFIMILLFYFTILLITVIIVIRVTVTIIATVMMMSIHFVCTPSLPSFLSYPITLYNL